MSAHTEPNPVQPDGVSAPAFDSSALPVPAAEAEARIRRMSRRSLLMAAAASVSAYSGWRWLSTRSPVDGTLWPLRRALEKNEALNRAYYSSGRLAPTYDASLASPDPRVNGDLGLSDDFDPDTWKLRLMGLADMSRAVQPTAPASAASTDAPSNGLSSGPAVEVGLKEIKTLPYHEMTTELHCIEGWTEVVHWGGARLSDFMQKYPPATRSGAKADVANNPHDLPEYVYLETPDGGYYVGLEMASALHPQTLLCYNINGQPLSMDHGAPLRLVVPVKYGVKNIKRIGVIRYTNSRPPDYWAENGYDWYAGL